MLPSKLSARLPARLRSVIGGVFAATFWCAVWQLLSMAVHQELLLPSPAAVACALGRLFATRLFWESAGASLLRVAAGFAAAVILGSLLAVLTARFRFASLLLSPVLRIVRAAPVASFILLAFVWLRTDILPGFIAFLMVVPVVWGNVEKGIRETDRGLLEMTAVYRLGAVRTLLLVRIPSVMPYFMAACTTGLGFAWKSGIAAEVIAYPALSIGRQLNNAKIYLETPELFAWTATVVLLSILLEKLLVAAASRFGGRSNAV